MREIPQSMTFELKAWNNGKGIDLRTWTSCTGSFRLAVGYAEWFWPDFDLVEGYIVQAGTTVAEVRQCEEEGVERRIIEASINHLDLINTNYSDYENLSEDLLIRLGAILKEIYEAKLQWQFPSRPCAVSFFIPEDREQFDEYGITFWQKAHEQQNKQNKSE